MSVDYVDTLNNRVKCLKKLTAMVTETDMIDYGNSFDKLTEYNGKKIFVPRECNSSSKSERSVTLPIVRQGCSVT